MTTFLIILAILLAIFAGLQAYVRFAPTKTADWTITPSDKAPGDYKAEGSFTAVRFVEGDGSDFLQQFQRSILAEPRTEKLGTVQGQEIYVSRSKLWGFPDYTTVALAADPASGKTHATVFGRLRFGKGDMGVNADRLKRVLSRVGASANG